MVTVTPAQSEVMSTPVPLINCPISPHVIDAPPLCIATLSNKRPREQTSLHTSTFATPYTGEPNILPYSSGNPCMVIATCRMSRIRGEGDRQRRVFRVAQTPSTAVQLPYALRTC